MLRRSYWLVGLPVAFLLGFTAHMGVSTPQTCTFALCVFAALLASLLLAC